MGLFKIATGKNIIGIESDIAWATPKTWTENNFPCGEGGEGCEANTGIFMDPAYQFI